MAILLLLFLVLLIAGFYYFNAIFAFIAGFFLVLFAIAGLMAYKDYRTGKKK